MTDKPSGKISFTCDFCGKRDTEVRRIFVGSRWDGKDHPLCDECLFVFIRIMIHEDREWFEKEIDEIKARLGRPDFLRVRCAQIKTLEFSCV